MNSFLRTTFRFIWILLFIALVIIAALLMLSILFIFMQIPFFWLRTINMKWFLAGTSATLGIVFFAVYGWYMSKPLFHLILWLKQLSKGVYQEPTDRRGKPASQGKRPDTFRHPYHLYRDLIRHMRQFTELLRRNEKERAEIEQMKQEWIAGVTHDLKTPLSYIEGYAAMLAATDYDWGEEEKRQFIRHIQEKTTQMKQLIRDLSASLQMDEGRIRLSPQEEDFVEFVRRTVIDIANRPGREEYRFSFESNVTSFNTAFDMKLLQRALQNILTNAVTHNPPMTNIEVKLLCTDAMTSILIRDDGLGMDREMMEHLFERYYRGMPKDTEDASTGLGLSIAKQLILAHGGSLETESEPGTGVAVWIVLPLKKFA
ncbi:ATP-binding protein [Paenibacillus elgii]